MTFDCIPTTLRNELVVDVRSVLEWPPSAGDFKEENIPGRFANNLL